MANPILTPKKANIYVPGHGVVAKADFTQAHAKAILKHTGKHGVSQEKCIAQHFTVSVGNLPLFEDEADAAAENQAQLDKEAAELKQLEAEIAADEKKVKDKTGK